MTNLNEMKCADLRVMARELGIKEYGNKGKGWLIPRIQEVLDARAAEEAAKKAAEEAAKQEAKKPAHRENPVVRNVYEFNGKKLSIGGWAKELGIPVSTLRARLRNGWTIEQTLGNASAGKSEKLIEFNGKKQNLSAWAKELNVPRATLDARINRLHWTPERALGSIAVANY